MPWNAQPKGGKELMRAKPIRIKPKTRTIATQPKVLHSHRLIAILDNLIAGSIAALFAGIALPQWCGSASQIDWVIEVLLAFSTISLYASGMYIQKRIEI